jgi:heme oxygenase (mycobilin-producing)
MAKILIRRIIPANTDQQLDKLLRQMRTATLNCEGYISGETLHRVDVPGEVLVISSWRSTRDWNNWFISRERLEIQAEIDKLLTTPTEYAVYENA